MDYGRIAARRLSQARYRERHREKINAASREAKGLKRRAAGKVIRWQMSLPFPRVLSDQKRQQYSAARANRYKNDPQVRAEAIARASNRATLKRREVTEYKSQWRARRSAVDPLFSITLRLRRRVWAAFRRRNFSKGSSVFDLLGADAKTVMNHIESTFKDGMTWANRSDWHIDHVTPLAKAETQQDLERLMHYSNLQALWAKENLSKGAR